MKATIICLDTQYLKHALIMAAALEHFSPMDIGEIITAENIDTDLSDSDFFFIWNGVDISIPGFENILKCLTLYPPSNRCWNCNAEIKDQIK